MGGRQGQEGGMGERGKQEGHNEDEPCYGPGVFPAKKTSTTYDILGLDCQGYSAWATRVGETSGWAWIGGGRAYYGLRFCRIQGQSTSALRRGWRGS